MFQVGDIVESTDRVSFQRGVITAVVGRLYTVRWDTGQISREHRGSIRLA